MDSDLEKTHLGLQSIEQFAKIFGNPDDIYTKITAEIILEMLMNDNFLEENDDNSLVSSEKR